MLYNTENVVVVEKKYCRGSLHFIYTVPVSVPEGERSIKKSVGDIFAISNDASLAFKFHTQNVGHSTRTTVNVLNSTIVFDDEVDEYDDDDTPLSYTKSDTLARMFAQSLTTVLKDGYSDCDDIFYKQMKQVSDENNLRLHFDRVHIYYKGYYQLCVFTDEFWGKMHIDDNAVFAYSEEYAKKLEAAGYYTNHIPEEIAIIVDDRFVTTLAIVCYKRQ